jgi:hypothetical protein
LQPLIIEQGGLDGSIGTDTLTFDHALDLLLQGIILGLRLDKGGLFANRARGLRGDCGKTGLCVCVGAGNGTNAGTQQQRRCEK